MNQKYAFLRIIKWVYRVVGAILALAGVLIGAFLMLTPSLVIDPTTYAVSSGAPAIGSGIAAAAIGLILGVLLEGFAELLTVFMDTEENTRLTTALLKQMIRNQTKPATPPKGGVRSLLDTEPEF